MTGVTATVAVDAAWPSVRKSLQESRLFVLAVAAQVAVGATLCGLVGRPLIVGLGDCYLAFLTAFGVLGLVVFAIEIFKRRSKFAQDTPATIAYRNALLAFRRDFLTRDYVLLVMIAFVLAPMAMSSFSAAKQAIPFVHPFSWDARLGTLFDPISGGRPLWQVLQPILGRPRITAGLDYFYDRVCTTLLVAPVVWASLLQPSQLRRRCLVSYVLVFLIVGNIFALAFSSAGPAYFGRLLPGTPNPYAALMTYLHSLDARTPLLAVRGQEGLWTAFQHGNVVFGWGISAMPSIHVAAAVLASLFAFKLSVRVGLFLGVVAACTFVASTALGWHYAVDGYAGALLACATWWLAGRLTGGGRSPT